MSDATTANGILQSNDGTLDNSAMEKVEIPIDRNIADTLESNITAGERTNDAPPMESTMNPSSDGVTVSGNPSTNWYVEVIASPTKEENTSSSPVPSPVPPAAPPPPPPPSSQSQNLKGRRSSESTRSICPVCEKDSVKKKNAIDVLKCSVCANYVHFSCTDLPAYMLFSLSSSSKKYTCSLCTKTPEHFLTGIVSGICRQPNNNSDSINTNNNSSNNNNSKDTNILDERYHTIENKINSLSVILEKFDLQNVVENLTNLGNKLEKTNGDMTAGVKEVNQMKKELTLAKPIDSAFLSENRTETESSQLRNDLEFTQKELSASRIANELLTSTLNERDVSLTSLRQRFEGAVSKLNEKEKHLVSVEAANKQLRDLQSKMEETKVSAVRTWSTKITTITHERDNFAEQVRVLNERIQDASSKYEQITTINAVLKDQLAEATQQNKSLQQSFQRMSGHKTVRRQRNSNEDADSSNGTEEGGNDGRDRDEEEEDDEDERDEVIIFHDSLCGPVNKSLLSREGIQVKKVWAPDMEKTEEALGEANSKVIVLEAWTWDLDKLEVEEMNLRVVDIVEAALTKADKVVISTIINRTDIRDINLKINMVNSFIKLKYMRHDSIVICDNFKLQSNNFRKPDNLHLNDDGVRVFASNLKYTIAEAIGVEVITKDAIRRDQRNEYRRRSSGRRY